VPALGGAQGEGRVRDQGRGTRERRIHHPHGHAGIGATKDLRIDPDLFHEVLRVNAVKLDQTVQDLTQGSEGAVGFHGGP
jgi:hypothetical protein